MSPRYDTSWLDVGVGDNDTFTIQDYGQLRRVVSELPDPDHQYPKVSIFLGNRAKRDVLQALFPNNNIRRTRCTASIGLRYANPTMNNREPHLFVDGELSVTRSTQIGGDRPVVHDYPVAWSPASAQAALHIIYASLVFLFADIICIFGDDFPSLQSVAQFLIDSVRAASTSQRTNRVRPKVIVILTRHPDHVRTDMAEIQRFYQYLHAIGWHRVTACFSAVNVVHATRVPDSLPYDNLRAAIDAQLDDAQELRRDRGFLFSASHLDGLFRVAVEQVASCAESSWDFVQATRQANPVSPGLKHHFSHYLEAGTRAGCQLDSLLSSVASALLMDHYLPDMMMLDPAAVFRTLYRAEVVWGCEANGGPRLGKPTVDMVDFVESEFVNQFHLVVSEGRLTVDHRHDQLVAMSNELGRIQSDKICLYCLVRSAQHPQACHHALCDQCAQLFGRPSCNEEYRFTLSRCLVCLATATLVIHVVPPTMNPTILAIDGGGVRGGIPLEYLLMIQESLGTDCKVQDLVDLSVGSSSGGLIVLGLIGMGWDVSTCSQVFDRLARRIFSERRRSTLTSFLRLILGRDSVLDGILRWMSWLLHDSCYDPGVFDASLREAFGDTRRIFDVVGLHFPFELHSRSKFGVVATTIAKETRSFVFGNFNGADWFTEDHEHELFRAENSEGEPLIWEVARATAAAPFYFSPANIHAVGSFQDGGLRDNFAAGIARRISRRIWPSRTGVARLLSLGTGTTATTTDRSPHFRHVFRDSFLRRGYDALMSNLDTEPKWQELRNQLDDAVREDYLRLDVALQDVPSSIDNVSEMDNYRNLVTRQPGSARMARDAATALLVSRFYFELDGLPAGRPISADPPYHGTIRCKGPTKAILQALQNLHSASLNFVTDTGLLGKFNGTEDTCSSCGRYVKPVTILVDHPKEPVNIYLRVSRQKRWRISGFPGSVSSFIESQKLRSAFGRPNHGRPAAATCPMCDGLGTRLQGKDKKRARTTSISDPHPKRLCPMDQFRN